MPKTINSVSIEMKNRFRLTIRVMLALFSSCISVSAQDIITLRNGDQIEARVTEISPTEIRYRRFNHLDGPVIVVPRAQVMSIRYENGTVEIISAAPATAPKSGAAQKQENNPAGNTVDDAWKNKWVYGGFGFAAGSYTTWSERDDYDYYYRSRYERKVDPLFGFVTSAEFSLLPFLSIEMISVFNSEDIAFPIMAKLGGRASKTEFTLDLGYTAGMGFTLGSTLGFKAGQGIIFTQAVMPNIGNDKDNTAMKFVYLGFKGGLGDKRK